MLEPEGKREQPDEDRSRPEEECDRRRMAELEAVDEAELVEEDHQPREQDELDVFPGDPERALAVVREAPEEHDRGEVADRPVGKGRPAVLEHVLREGDIQRPEEHRAEQHRVYG